MLVTATLLMAVCLSSVSPITPVASSSPEHISSSQPQTDVDVCTNPVITTDTTWSAGNVYLADCVVTVSAEVTLTVEAGAVVQFGGSGRGLRVLGTLNVTGSADNPAVFTSLDNDPANSWYGIVMYENSSANLDYTHIRYAGSGACVWDFADSIYNNCYNRAQLDVRMASLIMNNSEVRDGDNDGIVLQTPSLTPSIQNSSISNNTNNNPSDNVGQAINQTTINMQPEYLNLTFSGNDFNQVGVKVASLNQDVNLGGAPIRFYCGFTWCPIEINTGFTLSVQPGANLDMSGVNTFFFVNSGGTLNIQGTELAPVTITKGGVEVYYGGAATLSYCDISGGRALGNGLYVRSDGVTIDHCNFHDFSGYEIYIYSEPNRSIHLEATDVELANNHDDGMMITAGTGSTLDMRWSGGSVTGSSDNGITVSGGPVSLTLKDVIISGNGLNPYDSSEENGLYANANNISLYLENVQINDHPGESVYWNCNGSISAKNLSATGNERDALVLAGCAVTTGREWDLAEAGIPVVVTNTINVDSGGVLSITPGTTLGFETAKYLAVKQGGALYALGTADKPIVFSRAYETQSGPTA